jgi:ATP-dependent DNA helicase RecQ
MTDPLGDLRNSLRIGAPPLDAASIRLPSEPSSSYAVQRFFLSWAQVGELGVDQVVLLRQALRWLGVSSLLVGASPIWNDELINWLKRAGMDYKPGGELRVLPFAPKWLADALNCDKLPRKRAADESFSSEAYLESIGYNQWRSQAQKEVAWATITAPKGSTQVAVLPTGSGKSLCFQLLTRFSAGLTVVVVPTIALAIDQQVNAERLFADIPNVNPLSFASDDNPESTVAAVMEKRTRLLFTSPEACVSGRLRPILDTFADAKSGWFTNLVVDEAHLIESWGAQFRVEFQILAVARRTWWTTSGEKLRTFLFSATMSPQCRELLKKMFSHNNVFREFVCQRIRPEIEYYASTFSNKNDRKDATVQALWQLSRPAILYVTKIADAHEFLDRLRNEGFKRVESFHGDTRRDARKTILKRWKNNEIDLIVATSAFGVGVDKADVRVVVHACYPENPDRFYQEVGRGGRDGWTSLSFLMPSSPDDLKDAEQNTVALLTPKLIQKRWEAMFIKSESRENHVYALPVSTRHTGLVGTRTYRENVKWNKRLLLQLFRAGYLEFTNLEFRGTNSTVDDPQEWAVVRLLNFSPHTPKLAELIDRERSEELLHFRSGLKKLDEFLKVQKCASRMFANLYGIQQPGCNGCPFCRKHGRVPMDCEPMGFPLAHDAANKFTSVLVEDFPLPTGLAERANFVDGISRCVTNKGLRQFYCPAKHFDGILNCFKDAFDRNTHELHRIDSLTHETKLSSSASLPPVFFHINTISNEALALGRRHPSVHLFCGVQNPCDSNGRHIAVNENLRRWPSLESWISQPPESSLPCLPITQ